jgi:drug/metabolite transporter (DMT)-like permease
MILGHLDPLGITFWRFLSAGLVVAVGLAWRGELPRPWAGGASVLALFGACVAGLTGNYVVYLWGLAHLAPGTAQLVVQVAPMSLMLGSLYFFGERFQRTQWAGVATFFCGLLLFFHDRLADLLSGAGSHSVGVAYVVLAALAWAGYALAQKALLENHGSSQILVVTYLGGAAALVGAADTAALARLGGFEWTMLAFACLNTLLAYGALAEALAVWEGARVSAVLTLTPVATLVFSLVAEAWAPGLVELPPLAPANLAGAGLVVSGAMMTALGKARFLVPETATRPATP